VPAKQMSPPSSAYEQVTYNVEDVDIRTVDGLHRAEATPGECQFFTGYIATRHNLDLTSCQVELFLITCTT